MRITRLRLSGFKSFVEPTELHIDPGLTGVVGPNGCGKSNLLEAIRWVMGESSPKSMRGGGMDDVIFAGTANRPSRDFAEVTLVCESDRAFSSQMASSDGSEKAENNKKESLSRKRTNSRAPLPSLSDVKAGDTLEVVRRIERGAGSAYRANGHDVRAKDIALIFADAATGAHSPALVSQGKVANIISAKPQERRQLLEEAAGIAGLHVRRKDAEQKLRATEANLARVADMLGDMDARANALRRQARAAERYTRVSEQIVVAEARMIFARWREASVAADTARADAKSASERVDSAAIAQQSAADAQAQGVATLATARAQATALRDTAHQLSSRLAQHRSERDRLALRIAELTEQAAQITRDRDAEDALSHDAAAAIERLEDQARDAARQIAAREGDRPALNGQIASAADIVRDADVALAQAQAEAANEGAERRIAAAAEAESARRLARIDADIARLIDEGIAAGNEDKLLNSLNNLHAEALRENAAIAAMESDIKAATLARSDAQAERDAAHNALSEARSALAALESEAAALDRSLTASSTVTDQAIDLISAAPGYEAALAAALADDLSAPLLGTQSAGLRGWRGADPLAADPRLPAELAPLSQHVDAPQALLRRLNQIGVADSDDGQPLAVGQRLVTRNGDMRRWDGFVSSGDGAATAERLVRRNRRDAIAEQLAPVRDGIARIAQSANQCDDSLAQAEVRLGAARKALSDGEERARLCARAANQAEAALERHRTTLAHINERRAIATLEHQEATAAHQIATGRLASLPDGQATAQMLERREEAATIARATLVTLRDALGEVDRDCAKLRESQVESLAESRGWKARAGEAARRIANMNERAEAVAVELAATVEKPAALDFRIAEDTSAADALGTQLAGVVADEQLATHAMSALESQLETARETLATAREGRAGAAARADNAESRRIEMGRISGERFSCPPPLLPEKAGFDAETIVNPHEEGAAHERLSQDRERIGPVNLVAAQELAELEADHATAANDAEELQQAVNRLRGSIGHLNREGRARLALAFEQVDQHFQRLFTTLFGGGAAHLAMVDSDDPLEAGLEIMAQPPGKKLSALTLLSGGEQALTAIALIFALFLTNPAPICVLDEVDAPLDDANVERFCDLLDAMVAETDTRYLIVTHNAVTMARMHRLFGVTMVEQGISRLVSVDLSNAEQLLAAE